MIFILKQTDIERERYLHCLLPLAKCFSLRDHDGLFLSPPSTSWHLLADTHNEAFSPSLPCDGRSAETPPNYQEEQVLVPVIIMRTDVACSTKQVASVYTYQHER